MPRTCQMFQPCYPASLWIMLTTGENALIAGSHYHPRAARYDGVVDTELTQRLFYAAGGSTSRPGRSAGRGAVRRPPAVAMAVYLMVFQHVPVERAQFLIADLTGGVVSAGLVHSCLSL